MSSESQPKGFAKKLLRLVSKRKRDEEKTRSDLWKAMRDASAERLAAVLSSARTEFGDQLSELCADAECVLQRLMSSSTQTPHQNSRKVTLRERLLLADRENNSTIRADDGIVVEDTSSTLQAVLTLSHQTAATAAAADGESEESVTNLEQSSGGGRRLLSALLWEDRNSEYSSSSWVAFGVSIDAGDSVAAAAADGDGDEGGERDEAATATTTTAAEEEEEDAPVRVSLMSLLREGEEGGSIIFMKSGRIGIEYEEEEEEGEGEEGEEEEKKRRGGDVCCVCMGSEKGAAFIPCGHTFCRKCAREVHKERGCCPLCNKDIIDILCLY